MNIIFYRTTDAPNKINKSLSLIKTVSGELREGCDILSPSISLVYDNSLVSANYAYIPAWNRYYNITGLAAAGKMLNVSMVVDVLKTYAADILKSKATVTRCNINTPTIEDSRVLQTDNVSYQYRALGSAIPCGIGGEGTNVNGTYVITVATTGAPRTNSGNNADDTSSTGDSVGDNNLGGAN